MNLSKNEIVAFLALLLEKNPIVNVEALDNKIVFSRFNGETKTLELEKEPSSTSDFETSIETMKSTVQSFFSDIEEKTNLKLSSIDQIILDNVERYISNLHLPKIEIPDIDYSLVETMILNQFNSIKFPEQPQEITNVYTTEAVEQIDYSPDISSVKNYAKELYEELKIDLETKFNSIEFPTVELSEQIPVNYQYIENLIDTKIENLQQKYEYEKIAKKYVNSIVNRHGKIMLEYSDNSFSDITDVIIPIVRFNLQGMISSRMSATSGAGGYGGGSPGLSAYEIALNNGFSGSESQWLASLSGGFVLPEDGTIFRDSNNNISEILIGTVTTTFIRDSNGGIISVEKPTHIQNFIRNVSGEIIGWDIINI